MNEIISSLDAICVIFLKVSTGFVMLALAGFIRQRSVRPATVEPRVWSTTATAGNGPAVQFRLEPPFEHEQKLMEPPPAKPAEHVALPETIIECGNCGNAIKTQPVGAISEKDKVFKEYVCEHCGMRVRV